MQKTVLITGASSGFGKLTAEKLLATGEWEVYAAARRVEKMRDIEEKGAKIIKMDVTSDEEVFDGAKRIIDEHGRINAVLVNAGYGSYGTVENIPLDEIRYQYEVNVFGAGRVIKAVLPYMRKERSGRIVLTSSLVGHMSTLGLGWYASTKHALKALGTALRQEVKHLGIEVVMIEPGTVKTEFDTVAFDKLSKIEIPEDYKELIRSFHRFMYNSYENSPEPEGTAECMFRAVTAKKPKTVYRTTRDAKIFPKLLKIVPDRITDYFVISTMKRAMKSGE